METQAPNILLSFFAGLVSFLSPCVLPLVPAYIGYMSGSALAAARGGASAGGVRTAAMSSTHARWVVLAHSLVFVLGFTLVFVVVIGGLAGALSYALQDNRRILQQIMGVVLIVFGFHMLGVINIPFLNYTRRLEVRPASNLGYLRSFLIGTGFAIGWTPCIGPVLGSVFTISINGDQWGAFPLFLAYSLGLGVPFIITALAMGQISAGLKKLTRHSFSLKVGNWKLIDQVNVISIVSGVLLIFMGVLIFSNWLTILAPAVTWFNI